MIIGYLNNVPQKITIKRPCQGYYLRWYYNGWHYFFFYPGQQSLITDGEKYRTIGTKSVLMGSGQITFEQCQAIRTILNTREIYILTSDGWKNVSIAPNSLVVYDNQVNGYEVELSVKIGSKEISSTGFSPILSIPPLYNPNVITIITVIDGVFTIVVSGTAGQTIVINWGDGSAPEVIVLTGGDQTITHDYTGSGGAEHVITIDGEQNITTLDLSNDGIIAINIPDTTTKLTELNLSGNLLTETPIIPDTVPLVVLDLTGNPLTICEVQIGSQVWACKNHDSDYPGSKVYNDLETNRVIYGGLYSFSQINNPGFCPAGYRVPTLQDWEILLEYCGNDMSVLGNLLKETGITHWDTPNDASNTYGLALRATGYYGLLIGGATGFGGMATVSNLWTKTEADANNGYVIQATNTSKVLNVQNILKEFFLGVRLLKIWSAPLIAGDYFLPSIWESTAMFTELHAHGVGSFANAGYWTSSEVNATQARDVDFNNAASWGTTPKSITQHVRACRSFLGTAGQYNMRDVGPAGGLIFAYSGGKYYEAAPTDQSAAKAWSNITAHLVGTTGIAMGTGKQNTFDIVAQIAVYNDYFLPAIDELTEMYNELKLHGVGGFASLPYKSSSESNFENAWVFAMNAGAAFSYLKSDQNKVRACRAFTSVTPSYNLRDTGPAGGLIFWKSGNNYLESTLSDQSFAQAFSNITNIAIGTTSTAIGTGLANSNAIVGQIGHTNSAAKTCINYSNTGTSADSAAKLCKDLIIV